MTNKNESEMVQLNVRLRVDLCEKVRAEAKRRGINTGLVLSEVIDAHLGRRVSAGGFPDFGVAYPLGDMNPVFPSEELPVGGVVFFLAAPGPSELTYMGYTTDLGGELARMNAKLGGVFTPLLYLVPAGESELFVLRKLFAKEELEGYPGWYRPSDSLRQYLYHQAFLANPTQMARKGLELLSRPQVAEVKVEAPKPKVEAVAVPKVVAKPVPKVEEKPVVEELAEEAIRAFAEESLLEEALPALKPVSNDRPPKSPSIDLLIARANIRKEVMEKELKGPLVSRKLEALEGYDGEPLDEPLEATPVRPSSPEEDEDEFMPRGKKAEENDLLDSLLKDFA